MKIRRELFLIFRCVIILFHHLSFRKENMRQESAFI